jgi:AcrR family transcriptional regulator
MTMPRQTAAERRVAVLDAATTEFAAKGLHGASTEDIARAAGISQPYLFRLFGTKKELYLATSQRAIEHLYQVFADAAAKLRVVTVTAKPLDRAAAREYLHLPADKRLKRG